LLVRYYLNLDQQRWKPAKQRLLREAMSTSLSALLQADLQGSIKQMWKFAVALILGGVVHVNCQI